MRWLVMIGVTILLLMALAPAQPIRSQESPLPTEWIPSPDICGGMIPIETETQALVAEAIIPLASVFQSLNRWLNTPIDETGTTPAKLMRRYK